MGIKDAKLLYYKELRTHAERNDPLDALEAATIEAARIGAIGPAMIYTAYQYWYRRLIEAGFRPAFDTKIERWRWHAHNYTTLRNFYLEGRKRAASEVLEAGLASQRGDDL